jgi:hypothetical protein
MLSPTLVRAETAYVYLVKIDGKYGQTGFRVRGQKGIITALHGVAGAKSINVYTSAKSTGLRNPSVTIKLVVVDQDLALLTNDELENGPAVGFETPN